MILWRSLLTFWLVPKEVKKTTENNRSEILVFREVSRSFVYLISMKKLYSLTKWDPPKSLVLTDKIKFLDFQELWI